MQSSGWSRNIQSLKMMLLRLNRNIQHPLTTSLKVIISTFHIIVMFYLYARVCLQHDIIRNVLCSILSSYFNKSQFFIFLLFKKENIETNFNFSAILLQATPDSFSFSFSLSYYQYTSPPITDCLHNSFSFSQCNGKEKKKEVLQSDSDAWS